METKDWIEIAAMAMFYVFGRWNGYEHAKKKYRGF